MIERTLIKETPDGGRELVRQASILAIPRPVVILGDPGIGKTVLTETLGEQPGMSYIRAGTLTRSAIPGSLISPGERIIVDGLDEIASSAPGSAIEAVLHQLSAMANPPFILSCRQADWQGAADRVKVADDYGAAPVLLHLQPFTREDARAFIFQEFPEIDGDGLLLHLEDRGIEALFGNPLTLRLLGEVARGEGPLPDTRAQLFDRACRVMLPDANQRHHADSHVQRSKEELLWAAGSICAAQLLCDRVGVYTGPTAETPEGFLHLSDVSGLPHGQAAHDALRTRLFTADGEKRFTHIHRVIAEFLGAKWLARCFENGVSERRIFSLFQQGEGVPTSLRGLHAWMAHFSDGLAGRCIDADPYAVLRYGDAEILGLDRARALLAALKRLSEQDPYFRSEDWGKHPASGLTRPDLVDEIRAIVETPGRHTQLASVLLEAMAGTAIVGDLTPTLKAIMFDSNHSFDERSYAWEALEVANLPNDPEGIIRRLVEMGDSESARLACNALVHVGVRAVSLETAMDTVLAHLGLATLPNDDSFSQGNRDVPDGLFHNVNTGWLASFLDVLVERARPVMDGVNHASESDFADLVRRLVHQILERDPGIEPTRLWSWIGWIEGTYGYEREAQTRLVRIFRENHALRAALQEHVLLTPCADNAWMAGYKLNETHLDLYPTSEDLAHLLQALRARSGDGPTDTELWRGLLSLGRSTDGLPAVVRDAATETANGDPDLLTVLAEMSDTSPREWEINQEKRKAAKEARRQQFFQSRRDEFREKANDIDAGEIHVLYMPSCLYLGLYEHEEYFRPYSEATPEEQLRVFLGDELANRVLNGFMTVLDRNDLPDASAIAKVHCEGKHLKAEAPMICGVAELLRRGFRSTVSIGIRSRLFTLRVSGCTGRTVKARRTSARLSKRSCSRPRRTGNSISARELSLNWPEI